MTPPTQFSTDSRTNMNVAQMETQERSQTLASGKPAADRVRIAHVQLLPLLSGVQRVSLEEFRISDPQRIESFLICKEPGPFTEEAEKLGVTCLYVPELLREISPLKDLRAFHRIRGYMRKYRFDVVHTHSSKTGILGRLAAKSAGIQKIVHTVHGFAFPAAKSRITRGIYQAIETLGGRVTDALICLNETDAGLCRQKLRIPASKVHVIANGVDLNLFEPADDADRAALKQEVLGVSVETCVFGMIGRLWPQKNPEMYIRGAAQALSSGNSMHFAVLGDGELRADLEALSVDLGIRDSITFLGWRDDMQRLLRMLDVAVLPSRWEGMPLVLLEASASGLPCLVTDIPGNRDVVRTGETGLLVPSEDATALGDAMAELATDTGLRQQYGRAARAMAESKYDSRLRLRRVQDLYGIAAE